MSGDSKQYYFQTSRFVLLKFAIQSDQKIGQIAQLPKDKFRKYINSGPVTAYATDKDIKAQPEENSLNESIKPSMNAVLRLDAKTLEDELTRASISFGKITVIVKIIVPVLKDIGAQWHKGLL